MLMPTGGPDVYPPEVRTQLEKSNDQNLWMALGLAEFFKVDESSGC